MQHPAAAAFVVLVVILTVAPMTQAASLGSDWHPDPDGDAVPSNVDRCPWVYDPGQLDSDSDGLGDACDPDFAPPVAEGAISDLRVEHVTPVGAWFGFTSPHDTTWGWTAALAWSTDPDELTTLAGFQAAYDGGDATSVTVMAQYGEPAMRPVMVTGLAPDTTYYAAATRLAWDGLVDLISPVVAFHTLTATSPSAPSSRPRLVTTAADIAQLRALRAAGDPDWSAWETVMRPRTHAAALDPPSVYVAGQYCSTAAILHLVSDDPTDLSDATALLDVNIAIWEDNDLDANQYRWENAQLAVCLDLLWDHLDTATRDRVVAAFLGDDERHVAAGFPRVDDTDEFASTTRTWILDGLAACAADGVDPSLAACSCAVLAAGLDLWGGVQLVKARRDRGFWAQSGGFLPDGTDYGQGTSRYWLQSFLALANAGVEVSEWAPFMRNNLSSMVLQQLTPTQLGFFTAGDVEDITYNWGVEDNSFVLEQADAGLLALAAGALDRAGDPAAAAQGGYYVSTAGDDGNDGSFGLPWRTVQYGLDQLSPGDILYIMAGTYNEKVELNVSGLPGNPITITNYAADTVVLDGTGLGFATAVVGIFDRSYLVVEGLTIANNAMLDAQGIVVEGACAGITIRNNTIHDIHFSSNPSAPVSAATNAQPLIVYGIDPSLAVTGLVVDGNEIYDCRTGYSEALAVNGNVDGFEVTDNRVHDITNIGIDIIGHEGTSSNPATDQARNGLVKGNTVSNCLSPYATSGGIYVDGGRDLVIENNVVSRSGYGIEIGCENVAKTASGIVVRNNLVYDNEVAGISLGGFDYPSGSGKVTTTTLTNNTLMANDFSASSTGELYLSYSEDCALTNNIFVTNDANLVVFNAATSLNLQLDYNLYFCPGGAGALELSWDGTVYYGLTSFQAGTGLDANSLFADPDFVSAALPSPDLHLVDGSPAVDRGDPAFVPAGGEADIDGEPRVADGRVDIGADEHGPGGGIFADGFESGDSGAWSAATP